MNKNIILAALIAQTETLRIEIRDDIDNATRAALTAGEKVTSIASLARVAVADGRALNRALYRPLSSQWHSYKGATDCGCADCQAGEAGQPVCNVCLAGAVIAGSLNVEFESTFGPSKAIDTFGAETARAIRALDYVRCGDYYYAYENAGLAIDFEVSRASLREIAQPEQGSFKGWEQFEEHLDSIEAIAEQLQAFEDGADERRETRRAEREAALAAMKEAQAAAEAAQEAQEDTEPDSEDEDDTNAVCTTCGDPDCATPEYG